MWVASCHIQLNKSAWNNRFPTTAPRKSCCRQMVQAGPCRVLSDPELVVTNPTTIEIKLCPLLCHCSLLVGYEKEVVLSTGRLWKQTWGGKKAGPWEGLVYPRWVCSGDGLSKAVSLLGTEIWFQDFGNARPAENQNSNSNERKQVYNSNYLNFTKLEHFYQKSHN